MEKVVILSQDDWNNTVKNAVEEAMRNVKGDENKPEFVTIKQTCEILCASRGSIYNWTKMGLLKIHTIAGSKRYKYSEILDAPKKIKRYERRPTSWKEVKSNSIKDESEKNGKRKVIMMSSSMARIIHEHLIKNRLQSHIQ